MELGLELSPSKAHRGRLGNVYARMAKGAYSSSCSDIKFVRVIVDENPATAQLSDGPVKVTATMSYATTTILKVVVVEHWRTEGLRQDWDTPPDQENAARRNENLQDLQQDLLDGSETTGTT
ncbi:uncharacterized protein M8220_000899 isoform 1-T2 [Acridotheres tristis]